MNLQSRFQVSLFDFNSMFFVLLELDFGNRILQDTARVLRALLLHTNTHVLSLPVPSSLLFVAIARACMFPPPMFSRQYQCFARDESRRKKTVSASTSRGTFFVKIQERGRALSPLGYY